MKIEDESVIKSYSLKSLEFLAIAADTENRVVVIVDQYDDKRITLSLNEARPFFELMRHVVEEMEEELEQMP